MRKRKRSARVIVSRVLIVAGLLMILTAGIYEAANYPWQLLGSHEEDWQDESSLPDPPPPVFDDAAIPYTSSLDDETSDPAVPVPSVEEPDAAPLPAPILPGGDSLLNDIAKPKPKIKYETLGILKIPKLGVSYTIFEGTGRGQLSLGVGHILNTPKPGQEGNIALAGHRQSVVMHPFRHLDKMTPGDKIFLKTGEHVYEYEMTAVLIVEPQDAGVLGAVESAPYAVTLITCHPMLSLSQRLVVQGRLIAVDGQAFIPPDRQDAAADPPPDDAVSPEPAGEPVPEEADQSSPASAEPGQTEIM